MTAASDTTVGETQAEEAAALCDRINVVLRAVTLPNFLFPVRLEAMVHEANGYSAVAIFVTADLRHRDTGEPIELTFSEVLSPWAFKLRRGEDIDLVADTLEGLFANIARHEFREAFHVGGRRVRDPHALASKSEGSRR